MVSALHKMAELEKPWVRHDFHPDCCEYDWEESETSISVSELARRKENTGEKRAREGGTY